MTNFAITNPFEVFTDLEGEPLENGYIYVGEENLNPITNPINVYFDEDGLYPAPQPIRTIAGYASRSGTPSNIFANERCSLMVKDKNQNLLTTSLSTRLTLISKNIIYPSSFGAIGNGVTDDSAAWQAAEDFAFSLTSPIIGHNEAPFSPIIIDGENKTYALGSELDLPSGSGVIIRNANFIALGSFSGDYMQEMGLHDPFASNPFDYKNSYISFHNCTFDAYHVTGVGCVRAKAFYVLTFDNCNFFRSATYGLYTYVDGTEISHELRLVNCNFREWLAYEEPGFSDTGQRTGWGIRIQTQDSSIVNTESGFWARPFYFLNAKGMNCTNFHPYGGHGFILGAVTDLLDRVVFDGCYFDNLDISVGNCGAIKFTNNTFYDAGSKTQFISFFADSGSPDLNLISIGNDFTAPNHSTTIDPYTFGGSLGTVYGYSQLNNFLDNVNSDTFWGQSINYFDYTVGAFSPNPVGDTNITSLGSVTKTRYTRIGRMVFYSFQILSVVPTGAGFTRITFTPPFNQSNDNDSITGSVHIFATTDVGQVVDFSHASDNVFAANVTASSGASNTWIITGNYSL